MKLTLYRKYRPQFFKELVGQNHIKTTLQNELEMGQVAQAYLFTGPRGTGKTTTARLIAKAVNCLNRPEGKSEPCNACDACKEISNGNSLDVLEIDAASHTGVDNVRENIISNSRFAPTSRKFKVFIIDEVHMLSISAFNALLKTLEEPPAHVIFILATTEVHKLPPTIISRCQRFDFHKVNLEDLIVRLKDLINKENKIVEDSVVELIARRSDGCIRDAESLLGQILSLSDKKITKDMAELIISYSDFGLVLELIGYLSNKQADLGIKLINRLAEEGVDLKVFIDDIIEGLRKILLIKAGANLADYSLDLVKDQAEILTQLAKKIKMSDLIFMINIFLAKKQDLKTAKIIQLPLELAVVEICSNNHKKPENFKDDSFTASENPESATKPLLRSEKKPKRLVKLSSQKSKSKIKATENNPSVSSPENHSKSLLHTEKKSIMICSLEKICEIWSEVLAKVKDYNHSLFSFLRANRPVAVVDDVVQIGVCYKFHQERINELKNRQAIENILLEILGTQVRVECVLVEKSQISPELIKEEQNLESLVQEFGGKIVE